MNLRRCLSQGFSFKVVWALENSGLGRRMGALRLKELPENRPLVPSMILRLRGIRRGEEASAS